MNILHKGTQKRIHIPDAVYFVTAKTDRNYPFFRESVFCDLFVENLRLCKRLKRFELYGWFLGYDHFHLLVKPNEKFDLSKIMQFLKRHISRNINIVMGYGAADTTEHITPSPKERLANRSFGEGDWTSIQQFDIQVQKLKKSFQSKYADGHPFPKFHWQKSFRDHYCRGESDFRFHLGYILRNPAKHKMPENWPYIYTNPTYADLVDDCGLN